MEEKQYQSPAADVLELYSEDVLCASTGTEMLAEIFHLYRSARTYRRLQQSRVTGPISGLRRHHSYIYMNDYSRAYGSSVRCVQE